MSFAFVYLLAVLFLATTVRSTFGFGESLIAVPLLALQFPLETAVPLAVLVSVFVALLVVVQDKKHIHFNSAGWLIAAALPGIPAGLLLLVYGSEVYVKAGLGVLIMASASWFLFSGKTGHLKSDHKFWLIACGFVSGITGGAYGLNGPPLVLYGTLRRWPPPHFRATLHAYFLPVSLAGALGYWYKGIWDAEVTKYFLLSLPVVVPAVFAGRILNRKISGDRFIRYVYAGLIVIGGILVLQAGGLL